MAAKAIEEYFPCQSEFGLNNKEIFNKYIFTKGTNIINWTDWIWQPKEAFTTALMVPLCRHNNNRKSAAVLDLF